jgi:H/ACA ribonucleoprotein complex subunit 4
MGEYLRKGVVLIDKPRGPTSHQVSAWVRNLLGAEKAGHAGTLDPNVSGVLPIALDDAAKALGVMLLGSKEYVGILKLHGQVSRDDVGRVFTEFTGPISQIPPVRAAVKRERRVREIFNLDILEMKGRDILFRAECESGTYIRTLCKDIGDALAVGGHMLELRRTRSGHFEESGICTLHALKDAHVSFVEEGDEAGLRRLVLPVERMLDALPKVYVKDSAVDAICHGADVAVPGIQKIEGVYTKGDTVAVFTLKGEGVAIGEALLDSMDALGREKGNAVNLSRVLMAPGTYPKLWKRVK